MLYLFSLLLAIKAFISNKGIVNLISYKIKVTLPCLELIFLAEPLSLVKVFIFGKSLYS